jgi:hypothetical protein
MAPRHCPRTTPITRHVTAPTPPRRTTTTRSAASLPTVPAGGDRGVVGANGGDTSRGGGAGGRRGRRRHSLAVVPQGSLITGEVEGRGTTTGLSLSPGMFDEDDGGWRMVRMRASSLLPLASAASATGGSVCNAHTAPFPLIHPPVDGGDPFKNDGAAYNPHAAPSFNFVYPPLLGGFFFRCR